MFDGHIMSRQVVCLGQLFPLNELSLGKLVCLLFSSMANKDNACHTSISFLHCFMFEITNILFDSFRSINTLSVM